MKKQKTDRLRLTIPKDSSNLDKGLFYRLSGVSLRTKKILTILLAFIKESSDMDYTADRMYIKSVLPILSENEAKTTIDFTDTADACFRIVHSKKWPSEFDLIYKKLKLSGRSTRIVLDTIKAFSIVHNADVLDIDGLYAIATGIKEQDTVPEQVSEPVLEPVSDERPDIVETIMKKAEEGLKKVPEAIPEPVPTPESVSDTVPAVSDDKTIEAVESVKAAFIKAAEEHGIILENPVQKNTEVAEPEPVVEEKAAEPVIQAETEPDPVVEAPVKEEIPPEPVPEPIKPTPAPRPVENPVYKNSSEPEPAKSPVRKEYTIPEYRRLFIRITETMYGRGGQYPFTEEEYNQIKRHSDLELLFRRKYAEFEDLTNRYENSRGGMDKLKEKIFSNAENVPKQAVLDGRRANTLFFHRLYNEDDVSMTDKIKAFELINSAIKTLHDYI